LVECWAHRGLAEATPPLSVIGLSAAVALALGVGVACIVWLVLAGVIGQPGIRSVVAHAIGGALLGWTLADGILRSPGVREVRRVLTAAVVATLVVGGVWELWEWATDALTGTDLTGGIGDTLLDLIADGAGAAAWAAVAVSLFGARSAAARS
jgi:hypothetical protein